LVDDLKYLKIAVQQAKKSVIMGGFPAGATIVKDGEILAKGVSIGFKLKDPTSHAETSSIRKACKKLQTINLQGATLYASLQPCLMCFCVAYWAGVSRIVYGCKKNKQMIKKGYYEGNSDIYTINRRNNHLIKIDYIGIFENEILNLIREWEKRVVL